MARGDTLPPARKHFAEDDGGPIDTAPKRLRYPCQANGCPMPGVVFLGGAEDGVCGWHLNENPSDWGRITDALQRWECVERAINRARRVLTAPDTCADPKSQDKAQAEIWAEMLPAVQGSGWKERLRPAEREHLGDWSRRLGVFLGARVKEALSGQGVIDETKPTAFVAEVRAGLRATPLKNPEE